MRHIKADHEINLDDIERLPTDRIKIPRKRRPEISRPEVPGNIELAKVTDPSVMLTDEESSKVYSKFAGKGLDGHGGNDVTIKTVDWGDFDVEQIVELLVLLGEKLSDKTLFEYQKVHVRRIFRSVLKCEGARLSTLFSRQCVAEGQLVAMADGTLKEIEKIEIGDRILSLNQETGDIEEDEVVDAWETGEKECLSIRSDHGDEAITSEDHQFLTESGWKKAGHLDKSSDRIVLQTTKKVSEESSVNRAAIFGYFMADGSASKNQSSKFTNINPRFLDEFESLVVKEFPSVSPKRYKKGNGEDIIISQAVRRAGMNEFNNWLDDFGYRGITGAQKTIPDWVMRLDEEAERMFINRLYAADGWVSVNGDRPEIGMASLSEKFLKQLRFILLRRGISGFVHEQRIRDKAKQRFWKFRISQREDAKRFFEIYGPIFGKEAKSNEVIELVNRPTRKVRTKESIGDVSFAEIRNISPVGIRKTYDITTKKNHNFICEGFVVHNSGKTETTAIAVVTLCVAIPSLAQKFPDQLGIFKSGFRVGVFGPNTMQAKNIFERVTSIAKSESAREVYEDPDIGTDIEKHGCKWSNGSFVRMQTADPKASIEGLSLDLIILDEIQDMEDWVINKSILPMGAWNNASVVTIGTTNDKAGYFYNLIQTNRMADMRRSLEDRRHSEFDYRTVIKYNPRYAAFVEQEKAENGVQSKHFQMNFCLKWLFEDGSAVSDSSLKEYAMKKFTGFTSYTIKEPVVVGIDIASEINSTVVTVGKIVHGAEIEYEDVVEKKAIVQICDWYELEGIDYPTQRVLIKAFLERYKNIVWITVDETGVGKSALQEMKKEWRGFRNIEGFVFNPKSKSYLRSLFEEYLYSYRIVVPSTPEARTSEKWQKWYLQMVNLQKVTKAGHVCFEKKQTIASARDDFPDSFFLMLHSASQAMRNNAAAEVTSFEDLANYNSKGMFEDIRKKARMGELGVKNNLRASRVRKLLKGVI